MIELAGASVLDRARAGAPPGGPLRGGGHHHRWGAISIASATTIERAMIGAGVAPGIGAGGPPRASNPRRAWAGRGALRGADPAQRHAPRSRGRSRRAEGGRDQTRLRGALRGRSASRGSSPLPTIAQANRIARLARSGRDFADLAVQFSTDVQRRAGWSARAAERRGRAVPRAPSARNSRRSDGSATSGAHPPGFGLRRAQARADRPNRPTTRPSFEEARAALASEVRARRQRILMEELANRLAPDPGELEIFDPQLQEAWRRGAIRDA